jgi:hypothetical protein
VLEKTRKRLETFPNIQVVELDTERKEFVVPSPVQWTPGGLEEEDPPSLWTFSEYLHPIVFRLHLPAKLQDTIFPYEEGFDAVEDFLVAYDGMVFFAAAEAKEGFVAPSVGPTIRRYLQEELLKSIDPFSSGIIPPSPMHLDFEVVVRKPKDDTSPRPKITYDRRTSTITIEVHMERELDLTRELKGFYFGLSSDLRRFYEVMVRRLRADEIYRKILELSGLAHHKYALLAETRWYNLPKRFEFTKDLSVCIGFLHEKFCEHSLAVAEHEEMRKDFVSDIADHEFLKYGEEYFVEYGKPDAIDYSVFLSSLEHMRTQLSVQLQNRFLLYAAIVGSAITVLGTVLGYMLSR